MITRAGVLPMTLTAGARSPACWRSAGQAFAAGWFALSFLGITLAHVSNNLLNDLFDAHVGLDQGDYPRALYAPHPILSGMISRRGLIRAAVAVNAADVVILVVLTIARGWGVLAIALAGLGAQRRLHRAAAAAEEARPGRARRDAGVGPADDRRDLPAARWARSRGRCGRRQSPTACCAPRC